MQRVLWIVLAGGCGALARYGLGGLVQRVAGPAFPWGTFVVNVLGSFFFGLLWSLGEERTLLGPEVRTIVLVGFMGAFTTFSTFTFESAMMAREGQWLWALFNAGGQVVVGLAGLLLGLAGGRAL